MIIDFNRKQFKPASNIRKTVVRKKEKIRFKKYTQKKRKMSNIKRDITVRLPATGAYIIIIYI